MKIKMEIISKELIEEYRNIDNRKCVIATLLDKKISADIYPRICKSGQYSGILYVSDDKIKCESYWFHEMNTFEFPIKLLFMTESELDIYAKEKEVEEIKRKITEQLEYNNKKEQEEREQYLKLKERFGNN